MDGQLSGHMIFVFCYKNNENLEIELLYELIDVCRDPRNAKLAKGDSDNADNKHQSTFKIRWRRWISVTDRTYCRPQSETSYHHPYPEFIEHCRYRSVISFPR